MWGPGISATICLFIFKNHRRTITFKGTSLWRGILFYYLIPVSFAIWNNEPKFLLIGLLGFISILGEELGWRGFLQDALKNKSDLYKAMLIGFMWEIWHFTNRTANKEPLQAACSNVDYFYERYIVYRN
jgi:membrane protease YdiL (CAAX protease family)